MLVVGQLNFDVVIVIRNIVLDHFADLVRLQHRLHAADRVFKRYAVRHIAAGGNDEAVLVLNAVNQVNAVLHVVHLRAMKHDGRKRDVAAESYAVLVADLFAGLKLTFSSTEMESQPVLHMTSMFLVASPHTKNEE